MHPVPAQRRRRLLLALALASATAAVPATAQAAHVTSPGPWKASNTYLVQTDLDGRSAPKKDPVAKVNHVKAGDWIPIECQVTGESAYGSTVWIKTGGLYVPDHYVKTYTDGFLEGVPKCVVAAGPGAPPSTTPSQGPTRQALVDAVGRVEYEKVYGKKWATYKRLYPNHGIIWKTDGCSVPKKLIVGGGLVSPAAAAAALTFSKTFKKSCDRHDFGYRNYGPGQKGGLHIDPTEKRRASIDSRFLKNMKIQCRRHFPGPTKAACYGGAQTFYTAVHKAGKSHFF